MLKILLTVLLVAISGCANNMPNANTNANADSGLNSYILRGDISLYDEVEQKFILAARTGQDDELYKLTSPLTKRDSTEKEVKIFIASMKDYFSGYASDLKCKSIVPNKDEYGNFGFLFYGAFKMTSGGGRAYVLSLIKEGDKVYVATVIRKFDDRFHARCRSALGSQKR